MAEHAFYIMSNTRDGLLYHGSTAQLVRRRGQHAGEIFGGASFCRKYGLNKLVYFEICENAEQAKHREWQVKRWRRDWKLQMISAFNPTWRDLGPELIHLLPWALLED